jgi:hypothetical protein
MSIPATWTSTTKNNKIIIIIIYSIPPPLLQEESDRLLVQYRSSFLFSDNWSSLGSHSAGEGEREREMVLSN